MRKLYTLTLFLLAGLNVLAQKNEIYDSNIATLQVVAGNDWMSMPVVKLNSDVPINISFDELSHNYHRYTYSIQHCEANWQPSTSLFSSDYLSGFPDGNTIDNIGESLNTTVLYTHYSLQIPNERCQITMGGNYKLIVYDDDNNGEKVLTACFMVVEPSVNVSVNATTNTDIDTNGSHQQVEMAINYGSLSVTNPGSQVKTVMLQNGRWDNAVINSQPQYVTPNGLRWEHNRDFIFPAGNEYHKFEVLDVTHTTMGLEQMSWDGHNYNAFVWPNDPRENYVYDQDADGAFYIRNSDNIDNNTLSDYVIVHFQLNIPCVSDDIYLNGTWTNDQFLPIYKMEYHDMDGCYTANVWLKQGYYSFQYLILKPDGITATLPADGSFYQTENKYQALIYYRGAGERTDRLVGYQQTQLN